MSEEGQPITSDSQSTVSAPSEQVSTSDKIKEALLKKWTPGTPLTREIANQIAKDFGVSPTAIYKARKKIAESAAEQPQPSEPQGEGATLQIVPVKKPQEQQGTTQGEAPAAITQGWTTEEVQPMFQGINELIEFTGRGPAPDKEKTEEVSKLVAEAFTAFQVPKGEKGGKILVGLSAVAVVAMTYLPYLRKKPPATPEAQEAEGTKTPDAV